MTTFYAITDEYIEEKAEIFNHLIERTKKTIARCRSEKSKLQNEKELTSLMEEKEQELKELNDKKQERDEAKAYEGKAEFIMNEGRTYFNGWFVPMRKYDTVEEILSKQTNLMLKVHIVPIGTYDRYKRIKKELEEIENMLN